MLNILDVFSPDPERSLNGVLYCWVVAHTDGRALLLLRRALPTLSGDALAQAIEFLGMLGNRIRWIPDDISRQVLDSFRWSPQEVSYLVKETGTPCKLVRLLAADPELVQIVLAAIGLEVSQGDHNYSFLLWILYRHLSGWRSSNDDAAFIQHPKLLHNSRVQTELNRNDHVDEFWGGPLGLQCGECGASLSN